MIQLTTINEMMEKRSIGDKWAKRQISTFLRTQMLNMLGYK